VPALRVGGDVRGAAGEARGRARRRHRERQRDARRRHQGLLLQVPGGGLYKLNPVVDGPGA
jgi:hypothetical protein